MNVFRYIYPVVSITSGCSVIADYQYELQELRDTAPELVRVLMDLRELIDGGIYDSVVAHL